MKLGLSLLAKIVAVTVATAATAVPALAQAPYLVVDASSGQVLLQEDATRPWNPASTTKMMTAYVALRAVQSGRAQLDSPLIASSRAAAQKPSKIGIRPGQEITLENALKILMVKSANDLAVVIAEAIGGSIDGFSAMMNAEARRLGMTESRFSNPHGFHAEGHQTSARDLAILARALLVDFPEHREMWGIGAVQLGSRLLYNTNGLIGRYSGASGMKTGFVCASGFNLVSTATRGGRTLIVVVLGASSGGDRVVRSAQLLDQGFGTWNGQGHSLQSLPRSGYASAPNMRSEICSGRRRGVVLTDDSDYAGAILAGAVQENYNVSGNPLAFFASQSSAPQPSYSIGRTSGRVALGPRSSISPVAVYLGRAPGSTAVALGPGGQRAAPPTAVARTAAPPLPDAATALAPAGTGLRGAVPGLEPRDGRPASQAAIRPATTAPAARPPVPQSRQKESEDDEAGAPMQLPGVITQGARPQGSRPGAQAAIRPRSAGAAPASPQRPQAQASQQKRTAQASAPKAQPKAQPKNQPRKKKVEDDDE